MIGCGLAASSRADWCEQSSAMWGQGSRRIVLVSLLVSAVLLGVASAACAAPSFYWYGENNSTCWQAGQLGTPSLACDTVGGGYVGAHMVRLAGGIGGDVTGISVSGDYCSYYELGDSLTTPDSKNESGITGYETPTPYSSYQESDGYGNAARRAGPAGGRL
jgi:hypothetical protein